MLNGQINLYDIASPVRRKRSSFDYEKEFSEIALKTIPNEYQFMICGEQLNAGDFVSVQTGIDSNDNNNIELKKTIYKTTPLGIDNTHFRIIGLSEQDGEAGETIRIKTAGRILLTNSLFTGNNIFIAPPDEEGNQILTDNIQTIDNNYINEYYEYVEYNGYYFTHLHRVGYNLDGSLLQFDFKTYIMYYMST
jgi:hypothetical protein